MSPTGAPFAYITGAAPKTKPWPLSESHPRKNQTRADPGAIAGICACEVVTFVCGAQSASTRTHATSSIGTVRAYLRMAISDGRRLIHDPSEPKRQGGDAQRCLEAPDRPVRENARLVAGSIRGGLGHLLVRDAEPPP